jgi:hypothetical protein
MNSVSKADRQESRRTSNGVVRRPPAKNNYETLNSHNHYESRLGKQKKVLSKSSARSKSKSAQKVLNTTVSGCDNSYTPLRNSP